MSAASVQEGSFLMSGGGFVPGVIDNTLGLISFTIDSLIGPVAGVSGSGVLASLTFTGLSPGTSVLSLSNLILLDSTLLDITASTVDGGVTVNPSTAIPEPSSLLMLIGGLAAIARLRSGALRRG